MALVASIFILGLSFYYVVVILDFGFGTDFYFTFYPTAEVILESGPAQLYTEATEGWFYLPWFVFVFIPLQIVSVSQAIVLWDTLTVIATILAIHLWVKQHKVPAYIIAMAMVNLHFFDLLLRAQVEGVLLLAMVVCWLAFIEHRPFVFGLTFTVMIVKPLNIILPTMLLLYGIWHWNRNDQIKALIPVFMVGAGSLLIFGFDYPLRYIDSSLTTQPYDYIEITVWKFAAQTGIPNIPFIAMAVLCVGLLGICVQQVGVSLVTLNLAITINFAFTIYANSNNYVLLIPAFIMVAHHSRPIAWLAYLATWTPLLRLLFGYAASWVDILYTVILLLAIVYMIQRQASTYQTVGIRTA